MSARSKAKGLLMQRAYSGVLIMEKEGCVAYTCCTSRWKDREARHVG
jgi:hypothetical protein